MQLKKTLSQNKIMKINCHNAGTSLADRDTSDKDPDTDEQCY